MSSFSKQFLGIILYHSDNIFYFVLPFSDALTQHLQMVAAEISRHDPFNLDSLVYFVDLALNKLETHSFHY